MTLPMPEKLKGKDVLVIYIDDNGLCKILNHSVEKIGAEDYIRFTTTHFSTFAVVDKDEAEAVDQSPERRPRQRTDAEREIQGDHNQDEQEIRQGTGHSQEQQDHDLRHQVAGLHGQVPVLSLDEEDRRLQTAQDQDHKHLYQHQRCMKGTKYYYKARVLVYDGKTLVAKSALRQCGYGARTWTK